MGDLVNILSWQGALVTLVLVASILSQVKLINDSLTVNDALFHMPVFFAMWQLMSTLGGWVVYGEFADMIWWHTLVFLLGVLVLMGGVAFSSFRLLRNRLAPLLKDAQMVELLEDNDNNDDDDDDDDDYAHDNNNRNDDGDNNVAFHTLDSERHFFEIKTDSS